MKFLKKIKIYATKVSLKFLNDFQNLQFFRGFCLFEIIKVKHLPEISKLTEKIKKSTKVFGGTLFLQETF